MRIKEQFITKARQKHKCQAQNPNGISCCDGDIKQGLAHSHVIVIGHESQEVAVSGTKGGEVEDGAV